MALQHAYSYTATFADGTQIVQDHLNENGDVSETTVGGSKFTDVMKKSEESELLCFVIHNDQQSLGVDLVDGHFEINGIAFWQHRPDLTPYKDFRPVYYRTVVQVQTQGGEASEYIKGYTVGWQVTYQGKNVQRFITV